MAMSSVLDKKRGRNIRKIREFRDIKQELIAEKLNITQQAYAKIENGEIKFTDERLKDIADILGVAVDTIDSFEDNTNFINCSFNDNSIGLNGTYYNYASDPKQIELYESQLNLLKEKISQMEAEMNRLKAENR